MTGNNIVYGLTFLTVLPKYECSNYYTGYSTWKWDPCTRDDICSLENAPENWRINYDSENSIKNWVDPSKLDLTCVDKNLIGSIGSMFFFGFAISAAFIPRLGEVMERKKPYIANMTI